VQTIRICQVVYYKFARLSTVMYSIFLNEIEQLLIRTPENRLFTIAPCYCRNIDASKRWPNFCNLTIL